MKQELREQIKKIVENFIENPIDVHIQLPELTEFHKSKTKNYSLEQVCKYATDESSRQYTFQDDLFIRQWRCFGRTSSDCLKISYVNLPTYPTVEGYDGGMKYDKTMPMDLECDIKRLLQEAVTVVRLGNIKGYFLTFVTCDDIEEPHFSCHITELPFAS